MESNSMFFDRFFIFRGLIKSFKTAEIQVDVFHLLELSFFLS